MHTLFPQEACIGGYPQTPPWALHLPDTPAQTWGLLLASYSGLEFASEYPHTQFGAGTDTDP